MVAAFLDLRCCPHPVKPTTIEKQFFCNFVEVHHYFDPFLRDIEKEDSLMRILLKRGYEQQC